MDTAKHIQSGFGGASGKNCELSLLNAKSSRLRGGTGTWDKTEVTLWPKESQGREPASIKMATGAEHTGHLTGRTGLGFPGPASERYSDFPYKRLLDIKEEKKRKRRRRRRSRRKKEESNKRKEKSKGKQERGQYQKYKEIQALQRHYETQRQHSEGNVQATEVK